MVCPLVVDLNGDGAKVVGLSAGVHFDHNGDGFAERTAWADKADGLLVWDRNGNGKIDTGAELFGDQTPLKNGQRGANGFDVLKEYDDNGDGVIDSKDAVFAQLRIWQDANQNGVTDAGELKTLGGLGIASFDLHYEQPDGPRTLAVGSYSKSDGSTGHAADDPYFVVDSLDTIDLHPVALSEAIAALPDIAGTGTVKSLHQAMAADAVLVQRYQDWLSQEPGSTAQADSLQALILRWAGTDGVDPASRHSAFYGTHMDARILTAIEHFVGRGLVQPFADSGQTEYDPMPQSLPMLWQCWDLIVEQVKQQLLAQTTFEPLYSALNLKWDESTQSFAWDVSQVVAKLQDAYTANHDAGLQAMKAFGENIRAMGGAGDDVLASLNSTGQDQAPSDSSGFANALRNIGADYWGDGGATTFYSPYGKASKAVGGDGDEVFIGSTLSDTFEGGAGKDVLVGAGGNDQLDGGTGDDTLMGGEGDDTYKVAVGDGHDTIDDVSGNDRLVLTNVSSHELRGVERSGANLIIKFGVDDQVALKDYFTYTAQRVEQINFSDGVVWTAKELLAGLKTYGTSGADEISGYDDDSNHVEAGDGDDQVSGGAKADWLEGQAGNDQIFAAGGADTLIGGKGNDQLHGGFGNDTYIFNQGDGSDTISDYEYDDQGTGAGKADVLKLGAGLTVADTSVGRVGDSLALSWGNADSVLISEYFGNGDYGRVETIRFADGTEWKAADIAQRQVGTSGDDRFAGLYDMANTMQGLAGNDTLVGGTLADSLDGGAGNDSLDAAAGDDVLDAGAGDDSLEGGAGNDILTGGS
ncbi:MAG: calcium-binding protein, partial [Betaproteobacteria bacterium]